MLCFSNIVTQTRLIFGLSLLSTITAHGAENPVPIDRHALVARHDIEWPVLAGQIPLGNGNFAFNADGTGLETVGGSTMSHWCWHNFPLPPGVTADQVNSWATPDSGRLRGPTTQPAAAIASWERLNPQPLNLGRIGFIDAQGARLRASEVRLDSRHLDLWNGLLTSCFTWRGHAVRVETCVEPHSNTVAVRMRSDGLRDGQLRVMLDFPAPARGDHAWVGDFESTTGHFTKIVKASPGQLDLQRSIDDTRYHVALAGTGFFVVSPLPATYLTIDRAQYGADRGSWMNVTAQVAQAVHEGGLTFTASNVLGDPAPHLPKRLEIAYRLNGAAQKVSLAEGDTWRVGTGPSLHRFVLVANPGSDTIEFTCRFSPDVDPVPPSTVDEVKTDCATVWPAFWQSGGAIDLSGSRDPRWMELERRIVLSQYEEAVNSAGDYPPAEVGLTGSDPWEAKWHFEMIWWHLAHYALWDRWPLAEKALSIYQQISPVAQADARHFAYQGLMWPKSTGPNGFNTGSGYSAPLLWKEPAPIFLAELEYRLCPTPATLAKWRDVVFGTAKFMADYPTRNPATGRYDLDPVWPAWEGPKVRRNTIFELAYWRFGLEMAQQWRHRLGQAPEPHWNEVLQHLAPLPVKDGLYIYSDDLPDTYARRNMDHLDIIGAAGMLPPVAGLNLVIAHRTVQEVARDWHWKSVWGWDFPWLAMAAARTGEPHLAIEALLNPAERNHYDERGICTGGPGPYLPGNGGLLYAIAMMAAGWDGAPPRRAPGFPDDGSWTVRWEGLKPAP